MKTNSILKYLAIILLFYSKTYAQFTSGNSFFIAANTPVSINGLLLKPTFNTTELVDTEITVSADAIAGSPTNSINRVYILNKPINMIGDLGITYLPSELNGNTESMLEIAYFNEIDRYVTTAGGMQNVAQHSVLKNFNFGTAANMLKITAVNGTSTLPVVLISFAAKKVETQAFLTWNTATEVNSDYFEIQRSRNGKEWNAIGNVASNGESKSLKSYSYTDISPIAGENLYRLKMVDNDGAFAYSKIVNLKFDLLPEANVYPNPVLTKLSISNMDWTNVTKVEIFNASGTKVVAPFSETADPMVREYDFRQLPTGIYLVKMVRKNEAGHTIKVLKK